MRSLSVMTREANKHETQGNGEGFTISTISLTNPGACHDLPTERLHAQIVFRVFRTGMPEISCASETADSFQSELAHEMSGESRQRLYRDSALEGSCRSLFHTVVITLLLLLMTGCGATQLGMCAPHTKEVGTPKENWIECFDQPFSYAGVTHSVFCLDNATTEPPVLLLHELTGLSPGTLAYAEELSKDFAVYVPLLFGEKGNPSLLSGLVAYWFRGSLDFFPGGEWGLPTQGSAPIVNWLDGVTHAIGARHSQQRIGIIGNCVTGPLPLALLDYPQVGAVVVAQPALPMRFWYYTREDESSLGLSDQDLQAAQRSSAMIYGLRFQTDCISHPDKQQTLRETFGSRFINGEIPSNHYQVEGRPINAHSTLIGAWNKHDKVGQASRDARNQVRSFLVNELGSASP